MAASTSVAVESSRPVVDKQHIGPGGQGAGYVQAALLTSGKIPPADAGQGGGAESGAVQEHRGEQVFDVLVACRRARQPYVGGDRAGEDVVIGQDGGHHARGGRAC